VALLVATTGKVSMDPAAARFFTESSYPLAHGRNVVNVILVDFRAMDTLGEISVVVAAAFGVVAMLLLVPKREEKS
jgi:multicomponent Na+:H+ antiporter subunit A